MVDSTAKRTDAADQGGDLWTRVSLTSRPPPAPLECRPEALNKVAALAGVLAISYFLSPSDYGVAATALAVAAFLRILPTEVFGDVLLASGQPMARVAPVAERLAVAAAGVNCPRHAACDFACCSPPTTRTRRSGLAAC